MSAYQPRKPACESCLFWVGKQTSYLGDCEHPSNHPSRVPFDYACRMFSERKPMLTMQSMVRGLPTAYYTP